MRGLNPLIAYLKRFDIDPAPLLAKSDISPLTLNESNGHLTAEQELSFINLAIQALDQPDLGLTLGSEYHLSAYGILGLAIQTSETLLAAARVLYKNILMTWSYMHWSINEEGNVATAVQLPLRELGGCHQFMIDRGLFASYQIFKEALGHELPLLEISIKQAEPDYAYRYQELFDCPINFDAQHNSYSFDAKYLYEPMLQAESGFNDIYSAECEKISLLLEDEFRFKDLVRQHLVGIDNHPRTLESIAEILFATPRTIQRKLAAEGTSYKEILEEVRLNFATDYLSSTDYTIEDVAYRLGYKDASAFCHAFKKWTGKTPRSYQGLESD